MATQYCKTRRKLALTRTAIGDSIGESYAARSTKNLFPAAANQMGFDQRELAIIEHWPITSRMPERYDRSNSASELLLRNAISRKIVSRWEIAPAYHLPAAVTGRARIGNADQMSTDGAQFPTKSRPHRRVRRRRYTDGHSR